MKVIIGFLVSIGLYILGEKQVRENRKNLGIVLMSGAVIILILTTFAMNFLYGYIGFWFAFILNMIWIALGIWISHREKSQALAVLIAVSGFIIPFLIREAGDQSFLLFFVYEGLMYCVFLLYAAKENYKVLHYVSFFFLHVVTFIYTFINNDSGMYTVWLFWVQHFILVYIFFAKNKFGKGHLYGTLLTSFFLNVLWTDRNGIIKNYSFYSFSLQLFTSVCLR